jgi:hypothetical protein
MRKVAYVYITFGLKAISNKPVGLGMGKFVSYQIINMLSMKLFFACFII